ncbi:MAG: hypothetical protein IJ520_02730 [Synergistaceae bacterium]|nr:hypothetical protein [Synergistaceae bacterium]
MSFAEFLAAFWDYAAEYIVTCSGIALCAALVYCSGEGSKAERDEIARQQRILLKKWGLPE